MLYRDIYQELLDWKNASRRTALCVTGARQVGKTTLIRHFAQENYENFLEINFLTEPQAKQIFAGSLNAENVLTYLTAYAPGKNLIPGKTLVFLDEIQECPQARTAIKFLVEDGRFDYVESGSLLGVRTKNVSSLPVGFETILQMHPLSMQEFFIAYGLQPEMMNYLQACFERKTVVDPSVHDVLSRLFLTYLVVGGMPQVVNTYLQTRDIRRVLDVQRDILALYRLDIAKYADRDKSKIISVFDAIPSQLESKTRRFRLADISKTARMLRYENSFLWLADAGVALPCCNVTAPIVPLQLNEKRNLFKLFMGDTGLLCAAFMQNIQFDLLQGNVSVNLGGILENVFAQELHAKGFTLHYYSSLKHGEVDFVIQNGRQVLPLEVKSGADYKAHRALDNTLSVEEWNLGQAFVFCKGNVETVGAITYLPWYLAMFLKPQAEPESFSYTVDISNLQVPKE